MNIPELEEPLFYFGEQLRGPERHHAGSGLVVSFSQRCPGDASNEDALAVIPVDAQTVVVAIADGVGGAKAGAEASKTALSCVSKEIALFQGGEGSLRDAILRGVDQGNELVLERGLGAGTTLALVEITGASFRTYHAGDSTIVCTGQRGKLKLQTVSHSPVGYAVEAGLLSEDEALHHEDLNLVSNVIGSKTMHLEMGRRRRLLPSDTLILGSDGLFDNLSIEEVMDGIRKGELGQGVEGLVQLARERMEHPTDGAPSKPDDLTVIAFRLLS